ncbi:MAG: RluA family pseudouridine synthase [Solobacterium sp.]|jgi:23S rRNA pseudouridine1911/1915/1917 synthase|nr:RluA family pseudouridine synthase [Solobacterium sp.]MCH4049904.1 RluA family pseudouridine synthase [Solobacterium sp.]MCH4073589.1 RluA family pseudouridine synthase [Solobacterium sp.]MCI1312960.1 RluA family pseudouridine synthase [Solobacterium sp.]MCI1347014.1 RluA family pseudouridine synthase [Solobacterium sp.]
MHEEKYTVETESPVRIDRYLSSVSDLSRTRVQELCEEGKVKVNGKSVKSSFKVENGMEITAEVPENTEIEVLPENIPLDILYEDSDIIVINKPKGMVVHPAPGNEHGTLVNALLYHCHDLSGINGKIRPGIVHRIDKDTTGCLVACKNDMAHRAIAAQLADKTCHREYKTVVEGILEHDAAVIDAPIGRDPRDRQRMAVTDIHSREARTHYRVIERFRDTTYAECRLETGRTHQIRVHMKYCGHPVLGDEKYGHKCKIMDTQGQVLHAYKLTLIHPSSGKEMSFEAPLPAYFEELLALLRKQKG